MDAAVAATRGRPCLQLLPESARARQHLALLRALRYWTALAAAAAVAAGASYVVRLNRDVARARSELEALAPATQAAQAVRTDLAAAQAALEFIRAVERTGTPAVPALGAIARHLPDSAFLTHLQVAAHGQVRVTGYAFRAASLLGAFERAGFQATFEGSVAREMMAGRERDRFTALLRVRRAAQP
jgi:Tfp pilus assembly protein PilN